MGGSSSKTSNRNEKNGIYAELVSGKGEDSDFPPIKVLLNEQITNSALDSLKDSEQMMHMLAKSLIVDALHDKNTPGKFGKILNYIFDYEATLAQTRSMLYWSISTQDSYKNISYLTAWQLKNWTTSYGIGQVSTLTQMWVRNPSARVEVISPLITWVLQQKPYVIDPVSLLIYDALPYTKDAVKDGLKNVITENLKSESARSAVKDLIVQNLVKYGSARSAEVVNKIEESPVVSSDSDLPSENSEKNVEANPLPPSVNTSLSPTSMGFDSKPL